MNIYFFLSFFNLGIHGEHTESVGGVFDISNKRRLGLSEIDAIQEMRKGVEEIIKKEKSL
jgi:creatine kinase